jgi:hypothetical protein
MRPRLASLVIAAASLLCGGACSSPAQQSPTPLATVPAMGRFAYVTGFCDRVTPPYCAVAKGRAWAASEMATIETVLAEITASEHGRQVITQAIRDLGESVEMRRFDVCLSAKGIAEEADAAYYNNGRTQFLQVCDRFFRQDGLRDRHSGPIGYRLQTEIIAHELFHVVDRLGMRFSRAGNEFTDLVGLRPFPRRPGFWIPKGITAHEAAENTRARLRIDQLAKTDEAAAIDASRTYARAFRLKSFPTQLAMRSPEEAFAEIGAHLLLDPTARHYLAPAVVTYFDERVFPSLR